MFEVGWSELLVIAIVLIVVVGPKDLPRMLRTFGKTTSQLRRMAGDFRRQFDEALREAELDDVRDTVRDMRNLDPRTHMRDALNPIRSVGDEIRSTLRAATKAPEQKVAGPVTADTAPVPYEGDVSMAPQSSPTIERSVSAPQTVVSERSGRDNGNEALANGGTPR